MYDIIVIGAGPAGISAAVEAGKQGCSVLMIEREEKCGGILKQCIHDGFGLIRYRQVLTGPEYALREMEQIDPNKIQVLAGTYVTKIEKTKDKASFRLELINREQGLIVETAISLVLATGCRERTARQIFINGSRPAGIMTAGCAQYLVNIDGYLPCSRCVILGSGDIGLIMARRLTLEGAKVLGVYEAKSTASGLQRNIVQCLQDYDIPLYLSQTVTAVKGDSRVEAVEISRVDADMNPIEGTQQWISCDGLILSVGLIPENEMAEMLGVEISPATKGPVVNQHLMTSVKGVFSCGNALHVNDLVDYVSDSGRIAGRSSADYVRWQQTGADRAGVRIGSEDISGISLEFNRRSILYAVPQIIQRPIQEKPLTLYFRARQEAQQVSLCLYFNDQMVYQKKYAHLKPPEMECLHLDIAKLAMTAKLETEEIQRIYLDLKFDEVPAAKSSVEPVKKVVSNSVSNSESNSKASSGKE